ncbi:UNVERIFIED_CONTAM: hypothetical protein Sangu_1737700 [Sesamum angustifolium]|uniref:Uncharacterized protein n=1 Tax=Sesamum angustifolium TaxID=2727405 RepID=A0AAW2M526_9LAMI
MSGDDDDSWEVRAFKEDTTGNATRRAGTSPSPTVAKGPSSSHLLIPTGHEFLANGFCLLYPLPNHNTILIPTRPTEFPSPLLPISHLTSNKPSEAPRMPANSLVSSLCHSSNTEPSASNYSNDNYRDNDENDKDSATEELDLELRLGRRPPPRP